MSNLSTHEQVLLTDGAVVVPAHLGASPRSAPVGKADVASALRDQAAAYVERRKADAARAISDVAEAFRVGGANLDGFPVFRAVCDRAAVEVDGLADGLANHTAVEIAHGIKAAARRRPGIATAVAVTAGATVLYLKWRQGMRLLPRPAATSLPGSKAVADA